MINLQDLTDESGTECMKIKDIDMISLVKDKEDLLLDCLQYIESKLESFNSNHGSDSSNYSYIKDIEAHVTSGLIAELKALHGRGLIPCV